MVHVPSQARDSDAESRRKGGFYVHGGTDRDTDTLQSTPGWIESWSLFELNLHPQPST